MLGLKLENIKCDGCVQAIKNGLSEFEGISIEDINIKEGEIKFQAIGEHTLADIKMKLKELGYPAKN